MRRSENVTAKRTGWLINSKENVMYDIDHIDTRQAQSPTAIVCENAAFFGATPARSGTATKALTR